MQEGVAQITITMFQGIDEDEQANIFEEVRM